MNKEFFTAQQAYQLRKAHGLIDTEFYRHKVLWYRVPEVGCVLKTIQYYRSAEFPTSTPMIANELVVAICPSITRDQFDLVTKSNYSKLKSDKGAKSALVEICAKFPVLFLYASGALPSEIARHYNITNSTPKIWRPELTTCSINNGITVLLDSLETEYTSIYTKVTEINSFH